MAVRFLPPPGENPAQQPEDRENLAEVIEFRSRLTARRDAPAVSCEDPNGAAQQPNSEQQGVESAPSAEACAAAGITASVGHEDRACYEDGVRILARRARSSGELRAELLRLEHDAHEVDAVIAEFEVSLYLDDPGLARAVTAKLRDTKRSSRAQIRRKLQERRLSEAAIEEALGELDANEEIELLREAAVSRAAKMVGLDRQTAERRLLGFLSRRGWSGEPAMRAVRDALDGSSQSAPQRRRSDGPRLGAPRNGGSSVRFQ